MFKRIIQTLKLKRLWYKNKKLQKTQYWKEFSEVLDRVGYPAKAEFIMLNRRSGLTDDGKYYRDDPPLLKIIK